MSPVAKALDAVQGETHSYLGTLLPTVAVTQFRLKKLLSMRFVYCSPLVDALTAGVSKRFESLFGDETFQLASAFHPKFRLFWLEKYDKSKIPKVKETMIRKVEEYFRQQSDEERISSGDSNNEEGQDDFFSDLAPRNYTQGQKSFTRKAESLINEWVKSKPTDEFTDHAFLGEKVLIDLFLQYNTPIPSSAAVERLFCMEKDILRDKRSSLSDETFSFLMFSRSNMHLIENMTE